MMRVALMDMAPWSIPSKKSDPQTAIAEAERQTSVANTSILWAEQLGCFYEITGELEKAIKAYEKCIIIRNNNQSGTNPFHQDSLSLYKSQFKGIVISAKPETLTMLRFCKRNLESGTV